MLSTSQKLPRLFDPCGGTTTKLLTNKQISELPFRRQTMPFEFSSLSTPLSTTHSVPIALPFKALRSSRSVEREVLQNALREMEEENKLIMNKWGRMVSTLISQRGSLLKINVALWRSTWLPTGS